MAWTNQWKRRVKSRYRDTRGKKAKEKSDKGSNYCTVNRKQKERPGRNQIKQMKYTTHTQKRGKTPHKRTSEAQ